MGKRLRVSRMWGWEDQCWTLARIDLTASPDRQAGEREAVLTLSVLVGAISIARAVDDPGLSEQIMASAAAALKQCILN